MIKKPIISAIILLLLISSIFIFGVEFTQAQEPGQGSQSDPSDDSLPNCIKCHSNIYDVWEQSAHGQGLTCSQCHLADSQDHAKEGHASQGGLQNCMACHTTGYDGETDTWEEDNIHCTACHSPVESDHPNQPMPTNRSEELCGQCHIQTYTGWLASSHGRVGVTCVSCHSQHTTSLRSDSISDQCASCHGKKVSGFSHSHHGEVGLSCADCHLSPIEEPLRGGNAKLNHSFIVELDRCNQCHTYQLHDSGEAVTSEISHAGEEDIEVEAMFQTADSSICEEPGKISLLSILATTGLVSLFIGIVVMPGIKERRLRLNGKKK